MKLVEEEFFQVEYGKLILQTYMALMGLEGMKIYHFSIDGDI